MDSGKKEPLAALFYEHKPVSMILFLARDYKVCFNKCSKNSPTSSGGEMNCTSEHICSKKSL